jgi:hypothetical protein
MAFRIQIRRDTSDKWFVNNPILLEGEFGYETDTTYMKIGDGTTPWNSLDYWNPGGTGGTGGTGGVPEFITVQKNGVTVLSTTSILNFVGDFNIYPTSPTTASVFYAGGGGGSTTAIPYFSVKMNLLSGNFSSFDSSRGPDGQSLTGPAWNYSLSNVGNNITVTHNSGSRPMGLATHATNSSNVFIKSPIQTTTAGFSLASNLNDSAFTVYGVNSANTGADASGTVEIYWTFGATL